MRQVFNLHREKLIYINQHRFSLYSILRTICMKYHKKHCLMLFYFCSFQNFGSMLTWVVHSLRWSFLCVFFLKPSWSFDCYKFMADVNGVVYSSAKSPQHPKYITSQGTNHHRQGTGHLSLSNLKFSSKGFWPLGQKLNKFVGSRGFSLVCQSTETQNTETKERGRHYSDCSNISRYILLCIRIANP